MEWDLLAVDLFLSLCLENKVENEVDVYSGI